MRDGADTNNTRCLPNVFLTGKKVLLSWQMERLDYFGFYYCQPAPIKCLFFPESTTSVLGSFASSECLRELAKNDFFNKLPWRSDVTLETADGVKILVSSSMLRLASAQFKHGRRPHFWTRNMLVPLEEASSTVRILLDLICSCSPCRTGQLPLLRNHDDAWSDLELGVYWEWKLQVSQSHGITLMHTCHSHSEKIWYTLHRVSSTFVYTLLNRDHTPLA